MKKYIVSAILLIAIYADTYAQGCVAIRSTGGSCMMDHSTLNDSSSHSKWIFNANNRYFKSFRHFRGHEQEEERVENGTEVINHSYNLDISLAYTFSSRWSVAVNVPFIGNARSSLYEHAGNASGIRKSTYSSGLGDIRLTAYSWLLNPAKSKKGNIQLGLGIKLPTGDYKYQDYFFTTTVKRMGPVDQSIQLGDGGTGLTTELNTYYSLSPKFDLYGNFYYLINPREQNGVSTARGGTLSAQQIAYSSDVMSVPDQYMVRFGFNYKLQRLALSAGFRDEGIPSHDLIGGNRGFRRPGYVMSAEPGITYKLRKVTVYAFAPIALSRNRTQSYPDEVRSRITGAKFIGDAAFADYSLNIGLSFKL